jgi:hypothetical protein
MAVLLNVEDSDLARIHREVYRVAKAEIPAIKYAMMIDTNSVVRKEAMNDQTKFFQLTSFFRIKPLYQVLSFLAYKVGLPLHKAPVAPSILSFVAISFLLLWVLSKFFNDWLAAVLSVSIIISAPVIEAARSSTPDALSTLTVIIALFLLYRASSRWLIFSLTIAVLVRVDNIIFTALVICFLAFIDSGRSQNKVSRFCFCHPWMLDVLYNLDTVLR